MNVRSIFFLSLFVAMIAGVGQSQPYVIHSGTLSSGGGRTAAGPYTISHTIGGGTADRTVNGAFANSTGFWFVAPTLAGAFSSTGTFTVTTELDSVSGSLRAAIDSANTTPGLNVIAFNIPGSRVHTISLRAPLPIIADPVFIDGYTQPGSHPNTNGVSNGSNAAVKIEISATPATSSSTGFWLRGGGSTLRGLLVTGFLTAIQIDAKGGNFIEGNFIGTDSTGTALKSNRTGIAITTGNNLVGGNTPASRNVISGNLGIAITVVGTGASNNWIRGNYIGVSATGLANLSNGNSGVWIETPGNFIGGPDSTTRNVIVCSYANTAIYFWRGNPGGNAIQGNYIGTNAPGTKGFDGGAVTMNTSNNSLTGNIIYGNPGVSIGGSVTGNVVQGNFVGITANGTALLGSHAAGIDLLDAIHTQIGGLNPGERNVVTVNGTGIGITRGDSNTVQGNYVGTNASGTASLMTGGAPGSGILIASTDNLIGGSATGAGNVIANHTTGITLTGGARGNTVQGNLIGTDATGSVALGNRTMGLAIVTPQGSFTTRENVIGGTTPGAGNVISGNFGPGIYIIGGNKNLIQGNIIGLGRDRTSPVPNASNGIEFQAGDSNMVGDYSAAAGNIIAFNGTNVVDSRASGIKSFSGQANAFLTNSIYGNERLGIDLLGGTETSGVTANDPCDGDAGPNGLQNYPVITSASGDSVQSTISGTLDSSPNSIYLLQFFSSPRSDTTGYGEGKQFLGSLKLKTDSLCHGVFAVRLPVGLPQGSFVTATATNSAMNTSEFSGAIAALATGAQREESRIPPIYLLDQNFPNPFNPSTTLKYQLSADSKVTLTVYNVLGQKVVDLVDDVETAGYKSVQWNAGQVASGIYFYRLQAFSTADPTKTFNQVKKMILLK